MILIIVIYGLVSNYYQFSFIAQNISLIKYKEVTTKNKWPVSWMTLAYFPMTALSTQRIINDYLTKKY